MDGRLTRTNCDQAGVYVVPNVLSPRDLVSRPDNMDETLQHYTILRIPNKCVRVGRRTDGQTDILDIVHNETFQFWFVQQD